MIGDFVLYTIHPRVKRALRSRHARTLFLLVLVVGLPFYGCSLVWPVYDLGLIVPSPDRLIDLVALRGDKAAFDSFFYRVYLFAAVDSPRTTPLHTVVWLTPLWQLRSRFVYDGYSLPLLRWTTARTFKIDIHDMDNDYYFPAHRFRVADEIVTGSLEVNTENAADVYPH